MSGKLKRWLRTGVMLALLSIACPVHAFYNPSAGRWLNRDPIKEKGGLNQYGFCKNEPVSNWDYLGLHNFKLTKDPLGLRPQEPEPKGRGDYGGLTWMEWGTRTLVKKAKGGYIVTGNGTSTISYWWSDPKSKVHEEIHVTDFERCWNDFISEADKYLDKPVCSEPKAECRKGVVDRWASYYRTLGEYMGDVYDCGDYGNIFGACDRAAQDGPFLSKRYLEISKEVEKCEKMP